MYLNINTDAVVKLTNKLERMRKSALPSAIRGALNKAAFNVKTDTMPKNAEKAFEKRQPNFFKANSKVVPASGFDIRKMNSTVGFVSNNLKGGANYAVKDLEQQEAGGAINKKSLIPMKQARVSNNTKKNVRSVNRISAINKVVNARNAKGKNKKSKFVNAALRAGKGGYVLGSEEKGEQILYRITSLSSKIKGRSLVIKKTPLYDYKRDRSVKVRSTKFMSTSGNQSGKKIDNYFISEAERQIAKIK